MLQGQYYAQVETYHFLQKKKPSPKSGIHLLDALITVEGKVAPHLVVQWGKGVLRPVVRGGMLPHPRGVQVGTVVLKEGMPQIFLQFKHKVSVSRSHPSENDVYHLQRREVLHTHLFQRFSEAFKYSLRHEINSLYLLIVLSVHVTTSAFFYSVGSPTQL